MIEFEHDLDLNGHTLQTNVHAEASIWRENYGEDADGNRGEMRTFIDDVEIKVFDLRGNDITQKLKNNHDFEFTYLLEKAEEKLYEDYQEGA